MSDDEIYERFIEYVSNPVIGFPESEHKWPMIKSFITPEEADFMTGFPMSSTSLEEIAAKLEMDPDEALEKINELCKKGLIYEAIRGRLGRGTQENHGAARDQILHGRMVLAVEAAAPSGPKGHSH